MEYHKVMFQCLLTGHTSTSAGGIIFSFLLPLQAVVAQPRSYAPVTNTKDNPPCNTLFIGNLSEHTSEDELRGIFQGQPGELHLIPAMAQQQQQSSVHLPLRLTWAGLRSVPALVLEQTTDVSGRHSGLWDLPEGLHRDGLQACRLPAAEAGAGRALDHLLCGVC